MVRLCVRKNKEKSDERNDNEKYRLLNRIMDRISENHTGAYAAQSAFFIVLSMIPFIMLLLALVQYTPVTKADVIRAVTHVLPKTIYR